MTRPSNRIQLEVTPDQRAAIDRIIDRIDGRSASEVFRRALVIMDKIVETERAKKVQFGFVDEDNSFTEVWIV